MADLPPASSPYVCDSFATVRESVKNQVSRTCQISFLNTGVNADGAVSAAPAPSLTAPAPLPRLAQKPPVNRSLDGVIELRAEEQSYDSKEQIVTATGNVRVRFRNALLRADQVTVDIASRKAVATGNVLIKRGEQLLRGDKFDYDFGNDKGEVTAASGDIYQPTLARDLDIAGRSPARS